jgi:hypothetical protein
VSLENFEGKFFIDTDSQQTIFLEAPPWWEHIGPLAQSELQRVVGREPCSKNFREKKKAERKFLKKYAVLNTAYATSK